MKKRRKDIIRILSAQKISFLHLIKKQKNYREAMKVFRSSLSVNWNLRRIRVR